MGTTSMKPRGAVESFLAVAAITGISFGLLWKLLTGEPAEVSTLIGLFFGILMGAFTVGKLTEESKHVEIGDREQFLAALEGKLAELGFFEKTELPTYRMYESVSEGTVSLGPISTNGLISRVRVSVDQGGATLVGPRSTLDQLQLG